MVGAEQDKRRDGLSLEWGPPGRSSEEVTSEQSEGTSLWHLEESYWSQWTRHLQAYGQEVRMVRNFCSVSAEGRGFPGKGANAEQLETRAGEGQ